MKEKLSLDQKAHLFGYSYSYRTFCDAIIDTPDLQRSFRLEAYSKPVIHSPSTPRDIRKPGYDGMTQLI
jgi:hypothetical protein